MKSVIKTTVLTLLLVIGYNVQAAKDFNVAVAKDQILRVELNEVQEGDLLTLLDVEGKVLYKEANLNTNFQKSLSLVYVPNGTYFLNLEGINTIFAREIVKKGNKVEVKKNSKIIFKPIYKQTDKILKVSYTNPNKETVKVFVYDAAGNIVSALKNEDLVMKKTFDFSAVPAGDYILAMFVGDRSYYKPVNTY